jgi:uncharacterized protein YjcR
MAKRGAPPGNKRALNHGAPRGNKNALKHGFYAQHFTAEEIQLLDKLDGDIQNEIKLLRAYIHRVAKMTEDRETYSENDRILLAMLNSFCANVGNLTTRRAYLTGRVSPVQDAITTAILETAPTTFPHLAGGKAIKR